MNVNNIHDLVNFKDVISPVGTQTIAEMALVGSAALEELQKNIQFRKLTLIWLNFDGPMSEVCVQRQPKHITYRAAAKE